MADVTRVGMPAESSAARFRRGLGSAISGQSMPLGNWFRRGVDDLEATERHAYGLVLVLPGIEGRSSLNMSIARGLDDGGVPAAVEIFDWTTGRRWLSLYHLRASQLHRDSARRLADRIVRYQDAHPGRPVFLIGHSGGCGVAAYALRALPEGRSVCGVIFLAAALSPRFDLRDVLGRVERGLWSFHSCWDWLQLGLGTTLLGTVDGRHVPSAGMVGFRGDAGTESSPAAHHLSQMPHRLAFVRSWHWGDHWSCANRVFVSDLLAPLLLPSMRSERLECGANGADSGSDPRH